MTSHEAEREFRSIIASKTKGLDTLNAAGALKLMTDFYREQRASDCDLSTDGDMLLFEWGIYPWGGESFRVKITRQLIRRGGDDDDDDIFQLTLCVHYPPDDEAREAANAARASRISNRWCSSPDELPEFLHFASKSPALALASHRTPFKVTLEYHLAG